MTINNDWWNAMIKNKNPQKQKQLNLVDFLLLCKILYQLKQNMSKFYEFV